MELPSDRVTQKHTIPSISHRKYITVVIFSTLSIQRLHSKSHSLRHIAHGKHIRLLRIGTACKNQISFFGILPRICPVIYRRRIFKTFVIILICLLEDIYYSICCVKFIFCKPLRCPNYENFQSCFFLFVHRLAKL